MIDENGKVTREDFSLPNEMDELINENKNIFIEIFGRNPVHNDPLFFHHILFPKEHAMDTLCQKMREVGASEDQIYATKMTGLIVTEINEHLFSEHEKKEWQYHGNQYLLHEKNGTLDKLLGRNKTRLKLIEKYSHIKYIMAFIIDKINQINRGISDISSELTRNKFLAFCLTKTLKTNKAISVLMDSELNEDSFALIRSLFENYLQTIYIKNKENDYLKILKAKLGLITGSHKFESKNNKINRRFIINVHTGEKIDSFVSNKKICESSVHQEDLKIYYFLYDFLSAHVHPDYRMADNYIDHNGLDHVKNKYNFEVTVFATFINLIYLNEIYTEKFIDETSKNDIIRYIKTTKPILIESLKNEMNNIQVPVEMEMRINKIIL